MQFPRKTYLFSGPPSSSKTPELSKEERILIDNNESLNLLLFHYSKMDFEMSEYKVN